MCKDWFQRKFFRKDALDGHSLRLGPLKKLINQPMLWQFHHQAVARGVAVGLFAASIPLLPFQTLIAVLLSLVLRANFIIAFFVSWISNPFTILPIAYFTYYIGAVILGKDHVKITFNQLQHQFLHSPDWRVGLGGLFHDFSMAFLVGLPVLALSAALIGYCLVIIAWHIEQLIKKYWLKPKIHPPQK